MRVLGPEAGSPAAVSASRPARPPDKAIEIVIAPFSNSSIRDWPVGQYATLIRLAIERFDCRVSLIGSPGQAAMARGLMDLLGDEVSRERVNNRVGKTSWSDLQDILLAADLVISNNSGIAHQSATLAAPTLAIYSGSHQPLEWGPRGPRSRAIMASVPCSPCGYERLEDCTNDHLCMRLITPQAVIDQAVRLLAEFGERPVSAGLVPESVASAT
jgi:ADP-heptose:LPS heptosyltransferase